MVLSMDGRAIDVNWVLSINSMVNAGDGMSVVVAD